MKNNFFVFNSYSRKGNLPILIFVIMTFVVCSYTLFIFLTNSPQVKAAIINVDRGFDSIYDQEAETRFFLRDSFEKALIKTYEEFVVRGDYLSNLRISQFSELQGIYYWQRIADKVFEVNDDELEVFEKRFPYKEKHKTDTQPN